MNVRPIIFTAPMVRAILSGAKSQTRRMVKLPIVSPYGAPGDRLWVREPWQVFFDDEVPANRPRGPRHMMGIPAQPTRSSSVFYQADGELGHPDFGKATWRIPLFMPWRYSRITLEVTAVRVERVQDIDDAGAQAEGIRPYLSGGYHWRDHGPGDFNEWDQLGFRSMTDAYGALWESLHGRDAWNANPWVWVIEFKRIEHGAA